VEGTETPPEAALGSSTSSSAPARTVRSAPAERVAGAPEAAARLGQHPADDRVLKPVSDAPFACEKDPRPPEEAPAANRAVYQPELRRRPAYRRACRFSDLGGNDPHPGITPCRGLRMAWRGGSRGALPRAPQGLLLGPCKDADLM